MNDLAYYNTDAFKRRCLYFKSEAFQKRVDKLGARLKRNPQISDRDFYGLLDTNERDLAGWLTVKDAVDAETGREPQHGFPAFTKFGRAGAIDIKLSKDGKTLLDFHFTDWTPGAAPATPKETVQ
ncbi:MAG: hypothetical protein KAG89_12185 [Fulvimarina manganoxydans]|uniref:hypothetical protein n=1 Tax=Fulvimarina manganoxydans TaxID=937218 RepID=UPI0023528C0B|nr:hypothetical protein [Fulvimarina manganoxydans]MCK5932917.1 hypothetical protein [Fulvimarina manganoxydans]